MEGFLIHFPEAGLATDAKAELKSLGTVIQLGPALYAIRTDTSAHSLLRRISATMPHGAAVLIARTNGAYFEGDPKLASVAKLLG
jgi:hypothetical protein